MSMYSHHRTMDNQTQATEPDFDTTCLQILTQLQRHIAPMIMAGGDWSDTENPHSPIWEKRMAYIKKRVDTQLVDAGVTVASTHWYTKLACVTILVACMLGTLCRR